MRPRRLPLAFGLAVFAGAACAWAKGAPEVVMPGFEMLPEGTSRLFVELTGPAHAELRATPQHLTLVMNGVRVVRRNDRRPLDTRHFPTPVARAQLVPRGNDVWFEIDLREPAAPTWGIVQGVDGHVVVWIELAASGPDP